MFSKKQTSTAVVARSSSPALDTAREQIGKLATQLNDLANEDGQVEKAKRDVAERILDLGQRVDLLDARRHQLLAAVEIDPTRRPELTSVEADLTTLRQDEQTARETRAALDERGGQIETEWNALSERYRRAVREAWSEVATILVDDTPRDFVQRLRRIRASFEVNHAGVHMDVILAKLGFDPLTRENIIELINELSGEFQIPKA